MRGAVDRIALGLAALGRPAYINLGRDGALPPVRDVASMRAATFEVLDDAYAAGVRHVDVARSYGRSEEFLAGWLAERGHADVEVSSKWGYAYVGQWRLDAEVHEVKEHSAARFAAQWAETLALLGERVGLYQVHSLTVDSPLFTDEPLVEALAELAANGVAVGFSTSGPKQADAIERAFALEVAGQPVFSAVQSTWNVLEPSAGRALEAAHAAGKRVLVKETLANGRLAVEAPPAVLDVAAAHETGPDAVAVAAVLGQDWADRAVIGPASPAQLAANLRATTLALSAEERGALADLAENPQEYWRHRSSLQWD
ncbi:aryl-alcohol dehydrogenase-like predicted oxidoreductase [Amycolatopsis lexingtonensis]|uniref:Aryl-alcohol dehydrogenase-like predicted oxidoreductase n=1 Tax=Amycolatopsis lexingtonensis TaxID=218822 RepID=A0ABR9HVF5_9PSEU|nr:aldo/keto reductase [Amycolatopsis lexingtonensis]MBE1494912.1 aryl-alcohol dehydrogenase-like predicted oxidoreductase [Amycolatopsis lexingtonensis]